MTNDTNPTPLELLEREISAQRNSLMNAIVMRKEHPTYGYTKAEARQTLARLEGMLHAHQILTTGFASASIVLSARESAAALGIGLSALRERLEAS